MKKLLLCMVTMLLSNNLWGMNSKKPVVSRAKALTAVPAKQPPLAPRTKKSSSVEEPDSSKYGEYLAVKANFKTNVEQMLAKPEVAELVNKRDCKDIPVLHKAVANDDELLVHKLLRAGAEPNALVVRTGPKGKAPKELKRSTALHLAAFMGRRNIVELLLSYGANIDATGHRAKTPLHLAALTRNLKLIRVLLDHGADITKISEGFTPLGTFLNTINDPKWTLQSSKDIWCLLKEGGNLREIIRMFIQYNSEKASVDGKSTPLNFPETRYEALLESFSWTGSDGWKDFATNAQVNEKYDEEGSNYEAKIKISSWALGFLVRMNKYMENPFND